MEQSQTNHLFVPIGVLMATDIVAQLADSLANTGVEEKELSYKGQGRKLDDAQSGECHLSQSMLRVSNKPCLQASRAGIYDWRLLALTLFILTCCLFK